MRINPTLLLALLSTIHIAVTVGEACTGHTDQSKFVMEMYNPSTYTYS